MVKYYNEEDGESYYGLPTLPPEGWDEVRQPFIGHECNLEAERNRNGRNTNTDGRRAYTPSELKRRCKPYRSTTGDRTWSLGEMDYEASLVVRDGPIAINYSRKKH